MDIHAYCPLYECWTRAVFKSNQPTVDEVELLELEGLNVNIKIDETTIFIFFVEFDCLCGLVIRIPGYRTVIYCASCEVRTEFRYVM
jgi:hypothetical protein